MGLAHMCDMIPPYVWHGVFLCVTCLVHVCYMLLQCVAVCRSVSQCVTHAWHVICHSFTCVMGCIHMMLQCVAVCRSVSQCVTHAWHVTSHSFTCVMGCTHMLLSYGWHASFVCVAWLMHMCDLTLSYDSFMRVTWHVIDSYVWHDSLLQIGETP